MKRSIAAGATLLLATALSGVTFASAAGGSMRDPQPAELIPAPHIDRVTRDVRDVPVVAGAEQGNETTVRIAGADRYETAALISQQVWSEENAGAVFLASGLDFPDALALSASFGGVGPLLLVDQGMPHATYMELLRLHPCVVIVVGGQARVPQWLADQAGSLSDENQDKCND